MTYLLALVAGYFALVAVLAIVARPYRVRLAALVNELVRDYPDNDMVCQLAEHYARSAYSLRAAPSRLFSYLSGIVTSFDEIERRTDKMVQNYPEVVSDDRIFEMMDCSFASVAAASPVFGALAYVARWAFIFRIKLHHANRKDGDVFEMAGVTA